MAGRGAPAIIRTGNDAVDRSLQSIAEAVRQLDAESDEPALSLTGIALTAATPKNVPHKLGHALVGWRLTRVRASAIVFDQQDSNPTPDRTLILVASADVTVDVDVW